MALIIFAHLALLVSTNSIAQDEDLLVRWT